MAEDPDKALEKLAEYRKESETKQVKKLSQEDEVVEQSPIRAFFIKMYYFNAVIAATLGFALLIAGWATLNVAILWSSMAFVAFLLAQQTMTTIQRLEETEGRNTTIDDAFVIILIAAMSLVYVLFLPFRFGTFMTIYTPVAVAWLLQIIFVNFFKPEIGSVGQSKGGIVEELDDISISERIKQFFTKERIYILIVSLVLAVFISIDPILNA